MPCPAPCPPAHGLPARGSRGLRDREGGEVAVLPVVLERLRLGAAEPLRELSFKTHIRP